VRTEINTCKTKTKTKNKKRKWLICILIYAGNPATTSPISILNVLFISLPISSAIFAAAISSSLALTPAVRGA
jgi:hypothetical protein